ncbi:trypsin-like peptidase domain-containing protein [Variovorax saccharolyticus]|uniref:trypsin-like peptidase domain-containing protein n=1 Tax=Variovorax saccharolyticus TaxID=3053516 RepID=UPI00257690E2|nr:trypsin-like peptidase domain-containing protein [Variovorax sp. J22R187]MDM0019246.1 trypsin-like peptidase domain-containing protein [Variovorax sp. J22R187]
MRVLNRRVTALGMVAGLVAGCASAPGPPPLPSPPAAQVTTAAPGFSSLVASRRASVVDIVTLRIGRDERAEGIELEFAPETDFADRLAWPLPAEVRISQIRDLASGLILARDGVILTSAHVLAGIDEVQVRLDDGRRFPARVIGFDRRTDVGLLKIDAGGLAAAVIGDSSQLAPGDWVAAIGAPFGFHGSVTAGVVSAVDRYIGGAGEVPFIQTDVAINPGSSGSPLFNSRGEVVAINSMIYSGNGGYMGLSFAVPINLATRIAAQLKESGRVRRARLGADFQQMTPELAQSFAFGEPRGALVVRVDAQGPARAAGLARGDIVTAFDGVPIAHFSELLQRVASAPAGRRSQVELWRHGSRRTVWVTPSEEPAPRTVPKSEAGSERGDGLGLSLGELSPLQKLQFGSDGGLLVREAAGAARSEGIRAGDIIVAANHARLDRVEDFRRKLAETPPGRRVALLVLRDRRLAYVPVVNAP